MKVELADICRITQDFSFHHARRISEKLLSPFPEVLPSGAPCPISFLAECGDESCPTNRLRFPEVRAKFEQGVVEACSVTFSPCSKLRTYVSVGCGFLAQDCIILRRLHLAGFSPQHIVLIDPIFGEETTHEPGSKHKQVLEQFTSLMSALLPSTSIQTFPSLETYSAAASIDVNMIADLVLKVDVGDDELGNFHDNILPVLAVQGIALVLGGKDGSVRRTKSGYEGISNSELEESEASRWFASEMVSSSAIASGGLLSESPTEYTIARLLTLPIIKLQMLRILRQTRLVCIC